MRQATSSTRPVRIAILDTGLRLSIPYFQDDFDGPERKKQVISYKDFVGQSDSDMKDLFGHGTFMMRLVAESAPAAEIMVARVAENTEGLSSCQTNIVKAIQWAGSEGADIISMSFGFPRPIKDISDTIESVSRRGEGVVFVASAGNSPYEEEGFPACHPSVISVYAANSHGTFLESNSQTPSKRADVLCVVGEVPGEILEELRDELPGICQAGSSVSTAIAAGISATMLAYGDFLPHILPARQGSSVYKRMHTSRGM
ncbi:hypothetical protein J3458_003796 [Metarhizium acridum]|uniref:uncharacterized protein n=1 Tax=Metarhizium acridum TaxID=92637 RepID=UPI001C6CEFAD|nr:hypothetical protein J3458_003788 [Metarhizium acridum]KAG8421967.1 hypothetical protein J3458_003796 [Metarhizium acridum]